MEEGNRGKCLEILRKITKKLNKDSRNAADIRTSFLINQRNGEFRGGESFSRS